MVVSVRDVPSQNERAWVLSMRLAGIVVTPCYGKGK